MSQIDTYRENLKEYARDIRLNLSTVLTPEGAPGLTAKQVALTALASAYSARSSALAEAIRKDFSAEIEAAKTAATLMAMTNVYYRSQHFTENAEVKKLPARLRMNAMAKPGSEKIDFELACLASSAIGGCQVCVNSHVNEVIKAGLPPEAAQSAFRIAATVQAAALAESIA
jgi:alkyl hydroperoxide reductase subunit D